MYITLNRSSKLIPLGYVYFFYVYFVEIKVTIRLSSECFSVYLVSLPTLVLFKEQPLDSQWTFHETCSLITNKISVTTYFT